MPQLEPTYLRYIYDGLVKGSIHPENAAELPDGLIGLYEEAFDERTSVVERQKLLKRFAIWALLKKEVSAAFVAEILGETEEEILNFISTYSAWFNSPESGKYQLYHERLKLYLLQKISEKELQVLHEQLISRLEQAIEEQKADEFEWYGLEYLTGHLGVSAMLNGDGKKLIDLAYSQTHWQRQLKISKGYSWTKNGLNVVMSWASKYDDDEVIECGLQMVDLHHQEQNAAPQIVALVAEGDFDAALKRIEQFGGNDKEGLQRKFILYMLCLMELTLLDSKDKPFRKEGIEKLLKHLDEQLPVDHIILDWNKFFSSYLVFLITYECDKMAINTLAIFKRAKEYRFDWLYDTECFDNNFLQYCFNFLTVHLENRDHDQLYSRFSLLFKKIEELKLANKSFEFIADFGLRAMTSLKLEIIQINKLTAKNELDQARHLFEKFYINEFSHLTSDEKSLICGDLLIAYYPISNKADFLKLFEEAILCIHESNTNLREDASIVNFNIATQKLHLSEQLICIGLVDESNQLILESFGLAMEIDGEWYPHEKGKIIKRVLYLLVIKKIERDYLAICEFINDEGYKVLALIEIARGYLKIQNVVEARRYLELANRNASMLENKNQKETCYRQIFLLYSIINDASCMIDVIKDLPLNHDRVNAWDSPQKDIGTLISGINKLCQVEDFSRIVELSTFIISKDLVDGFDLESIKWNLVNSSLFKHKLQLANLINSSIEDLDTREYYQTQITLKSIAIKDFKTVLYCLSQHVNLLDIEVFKEFYECEFDEDQLSFLLKYSKKEKIPELQILIELKQIEKLPKQNDPDKKRLLNKIWGKIYSDLISNDLKDFLLTKIAIEFAISQNYDDVEIITQNINYTDNEEIIKDAIMVCLVRRDFSEALSKLSLIHQKRYLLELNCKILELHNETPTKLKVDEICSEAIGLLDYYFSRMELFSIANFLVNTSQKPKALTLMLDYLERHNFQSDNHDNLVIGNIIIELYKLGFKEIAIEKLNYITKGYDLVETIKQLSYLEMKIGDLESAVCLSEMIPFENPFISQKYQNWKGIGHHLADGNFLDREIVKQIMTLDNQLMKKNILIGYVEHLNFEYFPRSLEKSIQLLCPEIILSSFIHKNILFKLFFEELPEEKIQRFNRTLNIQWAIDIKNQFKY